jgi:hypothetical protein
MKKIILILFLVSCLLFLIFRPKEKVNIQILNYGSEVGQVMLSYNLEKIPSQVTYLLESERVGDANFTSDAKWKIDNHNIGKISREIVVNVW